jgi:ribosomal protein L37AE/L43A
MTTVAHASEFVPHDSPCAQCGKPISKPVWSEPGERCVTYVWACQACDYEFTATAIYSAKSEEQPLAA